LFDFMGAGDVLDGMGFRLDFQKCCQLLLRTHNESRSVAAMRISNPVKDRLFRRLRRENS